MALQKDDTMGDPAFGMPDAAIAAKAGNVTNANMAKTHRSQPQSPEASALTTPSKDNMVTTLPP